MMAGDFAKKLRRLNPKLRIYAGNDDTKPAGVYLHSDTGEPTDICGVAKSWVPEFSERDTSGHILRGGWNRVLHILVSLKLIDKTRSHYFFGYWDEHKTPAYYVEKSQIDRDLASAQRDDHRWKRDELVDIGREIAKARR